MTTKLEQRLDRVDQLIAEAEATDGPRGESFFKSFLQPPPSLMAHSLLGKAHKQYQTNPTEDVRQRMLLASERLFHLFETHLRNCCQSARRAGWHRDAGQNICPECWAEREATDDSEEGGCTWFEEFLLFLDSHILIPIERASWRLRGVKLPNAR